MSSKDPDVYLKYILGRIRLIEKKIKGVSYEEFIADEDLQDLTIRRLEVIGEAVRNIPKEFRDKHSYIDWQKPADMRSMLIHGYLEVDLDIVWYTVSNDLPRFKDQIKKLM